MAAIFQSQRITTKYAALVVLLCSLVLPHHVAGGVETGGALVFRDARDFDGAQVLPRATVLVRNGRIAAVGPELLAPDGARVIDSRGKMLLPRLIDLHTHVNGFMRMSYFHPGRNLDWGAHVPRPSHPSARPDFQCRQAVSNTV